MFGLRPFGRGRTGALICCRTTSLGYLLFYPHNRLTNLEVLRPILWSQNEPAIQFGRAGTRNVGFESRYRQVRCLRLSVLLYISKYLHLHLSKFFRRSARKHYIGACGDVAPLPFVDLDKGLKRTGMETGATITLLPPNRGRTLGM